MQGKPKQPTKVRLDRLLVDREMAESRERAQAVILAGQALVNGRKVEKAGALVEPNAEIRIIGEQPPYVGRGGLKLEAALREFRVDVSGRTAMDVGASTGGFTDCLLQHGCTKVYAIDVGYGQLAWKLRQDPRVVLIERTNIRRMDPDRIADPVDIAAIDVSFISLEKVIPPVLRFLAPKGELIALIKPQFEVDKGQVGKGGIVKDEAARTAAVDKIRTFMQNAGLEVRGVIPSPITGQDGNVEFLLYAVYHGGTEYTEKITKTKALSSNE